MFTGITVAMAQTKARNTINIWLSARPVTFFAGLRSPRDKMESLREIVNPEASRMVGNVCNFEIRNNRMPGLRTSKSKINYEE